MVGVFHGSTVLSVGSVMVFLQAIWCLFLYFIRMAVA